VAPDYSAPPSEAPIGKKVTPRSPISVEEPSRATPISVAAWVGMPILGFCLVGSARWLAFTIAYWTRSPKIRRRRSSWAYVHGRRKA
jgi:hypothetical protein